MSKEIRNIVSAYEAACAANKKVVLATVVHVEGSSYRRPGARMLVEEDGRITGAISGGCLEGDALRRAMQVIALNEKRLITYDTTLDDDLEFGVQLGCNGVVHILFEPIYPADEMNPVLLLKKCIEAGEMDKVLVTLFKLNDPQYQEAGTCMFFANAAVYSNHRIEEGVLAELRKGISMAFEQRRSAKIDMEAKGLTALIQWVKPPVSLIVIGAGNDALPLVEMAAVLGWDVTVADGRSSHASLKRFPKVNRIIVGKPDEVVAKLTVDHNAALVLMTHNFNYDRDCLKALSAHAPAYIGSLGPKKRLERIWGELEEHGAQLQEDFRKIVHGPAGLDIGAELPEEIALSIIAEIKAVFENRNGAFLKNRQAPIHDNR